MAACVEDYDEELHDDPIKLCFKPHHSNSCCYLGSMNKDSDDMPKKTQIDVIDLTSANEAEEIEMPKPLTIKGDVCYQIKQLAIEIVDFRKFPWYYRKCIKYCNKADDINNTQGIIVCEDQSNKDTCIKIKLGNSNGQWKVQDGKKDRHIKDRVIPKIKFQRNLNTIDFKRNKGLVGLTITQKFVSDDVVVKKEEASSGIVKLENETSEVILNKPVNMNVSLNKNDQATNEVKEEIVNKEKSIEPIAIKCESNEITEILKTNSDASSKSELTSEILKKPGNDINHCKETPRENKTHLCKESNSPETFTKHVSYSLSSGKLSKIPSASENMGKDYVKHNSETDKRLQQNGNGKEQRSVKIRVRDTKNNINRLEPKKKNHSIVIKKVSENIKVRKDLFDDNKTVSQHNGAVIDKTSKQFQIMKKFVDNTLKLVPNNKLKSAENEIAKCNEPKPLDMPVLIEECNEKIEVPSTCRTSFKDSIVFENDGGGVEDCDYKTPPKPSNQQILQKSNSEVSKNIHSSIASNGKPIPAITVTIGSVTTHTTPVTNTNVGVSKPRVKYSPMTRDYTLPTSINETINQANYARSSQSLLHSSTSNSAGSSAHNGSIVQMLNAPQKIPTIDMIQHRLPLQQIPRYTAPPPYPPNYSNLPSYSTVTNSHLGTGHRMYGNNTGGVNSNFHYMYSSYSAPQHSLSPLQPPQWQANANFNANQPLHYQPNYHNPNSASMGWNNGYVKETNIVHTTASATPTNSAMRNESVSFDILRTHTQPGSADGKFSKQNNLRTPTRKSNKQNNETQLERANELVVIDKSSLTKRPYDSSGPEVNRVQNSALKTELAKRPKTAPLVSDARKIAQSGYSPPILPILTDEVLANFIHIQQRSKTQENTSRVAKCDTRKTPAAPMDKTRKISIEDYKKRICKNVGTDLYNSAGGAGGNTKGAGLEPNWAAKKYGNYYLEQDLGYSSDTTVKL